MVLSFPISSKLTSILAEDMVIFMGLLSDLFPGTNPARKKDIEFEKVIVETAVVSSEVSI